jgi:hypothetical protein
MTTDHSGASDMAWIEQRGTRFRVRYRLPDGVVTTGSDPAHRPGQ